MGETKAFNKGLTYIIAATGTVTTTLLVLYLAAFEGSNTRWTTPRILAAYALGIALLVLLNGVIALLLRMTCGGQGASTDEQKEAASKAALLPIYSAAAANSSVAAGSGMVQGKPVAFKHGTVEAAAPGHAVCTLVTVAG
ncbi:hypothetical protein OEZ86_001791 [Tetradesmus obliquus]|nr:hypothetical protein OEZ86_001791 [Tetradesmus obliquus]